MTTSKATSRFTVPTTHVLPNLPAWRSPATRYSVPNVNTSQLVSQGFSAAPNMSSDNNTTVSQVVPVTSSGTVYYLNPSSRPNIFRGAIPIRFYSRAPMSIERPEVVSAGSVAAPRLAPTCFAVQKYLNF